VFPITLQFFTGYVILSGIVALGFGYVAATTSNSRKKSRAILTASLLFSSWLVLGPLLFYLNNNSQPIIERNGRITSIRVLRASDRFYSAFMTVQTSGGSEVTVHCSGEAVKLRYYGDSGELIKAWFYAPNGRQEGILQNAANWERAWLIVIGLICIWASIRKHRRDLHSSPKAPRAT
jgi:hypothetical protein